MKMRLGGFVIPSAEADSTALVVVYARPTARPNLEITVLRAQNRLRTTERGGLLFGLESRDYFTQTSDICNENYNA